MARSNGPVTICHWGGRGRILGEITWFSGGIERGGENQSSLTESLGGDYGKLTVNEGRGGNKNTEELRRGGQGKFYCDTT